MKTGLSVVIPAYNEEANVASCLQQAYSVLKALDLDWEIIFVNDGSHDRTGHIAKLLTRKIPHLYVVENKPNKGYGGSLRTGFAAATKEFIAFVPADNQFDFSQIKDFLNLERQTHADIISGIRPHGGRDPVHRLVIRWAWNTLVRGLFGYLASDIDCGFKLFKSSLLDKVLLTSDGAMIDTQLLAGARARGYKVAELPVTHLPRTAGKSTGSNPRVMLKAWRDLMVFWWQLRQEILVEQGRAVFRWEALLLILVLAVAAFSRLYKIDQYMTFLGDEGRDVTVVRQILLGQKIALIGPGTSIGNMYLGPLYYYLMLLPLALARFSPVGPAVQIAVFSLATICLLWWLGRQWFGRVPALAVALLYALSPTVIIYSRSSWNPNIMPFFALLTMYAIWKVWRFNYWRWLLIVGVSLAFVLNSHYLGLLLTPAIFLYWVLTKKTSVAWRYTLLSTMAFLLLMSPLFIFDLRHNWTNARAMFQFFTDRQTTVNLKVYKSLPYLFPIWRDIVTSLLAAKAALLGQIIAIVLVIFVPVMAVFRFRRSNFPDFVFVLVWLGAGLVGLGLYKQHIYDHYFAFLWPAVFLLAGFLLEFVSSIKVGIAVSLAAVAYLAWVNAVASPLLTPPNNQLARTRDVADFITTEAGNQPFNLALLSHNNYDAAYRYFLSLDNAPYRTIQQQITNQLFVICETPDCQPINNPLFEIASFGWAKVDRRWEFPWGVKLLLLVHNPTGAPSQP